VSAPAPCSARARRLAPPGPLGRHQAETLALALLGHGARVGVVHWATGVKLEVLAHWFRHLHRRPPPRGPLPESSGSMVRTRAQQAQASLFGVVYARHHQAGAGGHAIDPWALVHSYELYLFLGAAARGAPLSINEAWILARDLRGGLASLDWCPTCQARYVATQDGILVGCPLCALYARAGGNTARTRHRARHASPLQARA
jgi:hypothetical protein